MPSTQRKYLREKVESLVEPDDHQKHERDLEGVEARWTVQLQQVDHLHDVHEDIRTVMNLHINTLERTYKQDNQSLHIESTVREDYGGGKEENEQHR